MTQRGLPLSTEIDIGTGIKASYIADMLLDILKALTEPEPDTLPDEDARLALTALLVRIARADHEYSDDEKARIDKITACRYGLGPGTVAALRHEAEQLEAQAPDTVRFTRAIKEAVPYEDRLCVVQAMWEVVLADGERAKEEDAVIRMAANFLGVSDRDSNLARQRLENGR